MHTVEDILRTLDAMVDDDNKREYAQRLYHQSEVDGLSTVSGDVDVYYRTNALAMAIASANADAVARLLEYWDKDSLNNPNLLVWGYRELYSFFHLAFDPNGQANVHLINRLNLTKPDDLKELTEEGERVKQNLIRIIRLLAQRGADPNLLPELTTHRSNYKNPAMAGGRGRGHGYLPDAILMPLTVEWILVGGKPQSGSWFWFTDAMSLEINALVKAARLQIDVGSVASSAVTVPTGITSQPSLFSSSSSSSVPVTHLPVSNSSTSTSTSLPASSASIPTPLFSECDFICPITNAVMIDPVLDINGHSYERSVIEAWLAKHDTSPMTNVPLESKILIPNRHLQQLIQKWQTTQVPEPTAEPAKSPSP